MNDNIQGKNRTLYKTFIKAVYCSDFRQELWKHFTIKHVLAPSLAWPFIKWNKRSIEEGTIHIFPMFDTSSLENKVTQVLFLTKKDRFWGMKEKVRKWLNLIIPNPQPDFQSNN